MALQMSPNDAVELDAEAGERRYRRSGFWTSIGRYGKFLIYQTYGTARTSTRAAFIDVLERIAIRCLR